MSIACSDAPFSAASAAMRFDMRAVESHSFRRFSRFGRRLARKTLVQADALRPGMMHIWTWGPADLTIRVTAGADAITIASDGTEVQVPLCDGCFVCPACGAS